MFARWPWRREPLSKSPKEKPPFRLPETVWIGDVKKAADWGNSLYRRNHPQEVRKALR